MVHTDQQQLHVPAGQVGRRIFRATGALMLIQVFLRGFGFIEKMILSRLFGTDYRADAYNAAKDIAFYLFQLVDQVIMHSFLPVFVQRLREEGEQQAWRLASTAINLLLLFMVAIAAAGIFNTHGILGVFMSGWTGEQFKLDPNLVPLTEQLLRYMLVAVVFLATSSLTYCLLNSYKQFALPASADLALKGTIVVFAIFFAGAWGPLALTVGFVLGAVAKIAVHSAGLGRRLTHYRPTLALRDPGLKQFGLLALPLLLGVGMSIVRQVMDNWFTSHLQTGSLSALKYARSLCDMPVQFFPFAFGIALFPFLADIAVAGDKTRLREMLMAATRMMILIFVPLAVALIVMRYPIINILFGSEKFDAHSAELTAGPLQIYAAGMLIGALEIIILQFFFAMSDTMRPAVVGIIMVPVHIGIAYLGIFHWQLEAMAIALALFCSKGVKIVILYTMMRHKLQSLEGARTLAVVGKVLIALVPFVAIIFLASYFMPHAIFIGGIKKKLLALLPMLVSGVLGMAVYFTVLHVLKVDEVNLLVNKVRGKLQKRSAEPTPVE